MKIDMQYLGLVKTYTKRRQESMEFPEGVTLREVFDKLAEEHGKEFKKDIYEPGMDDVKTMFMVMVNGIVMGQLKGLNTELRDGDKIFLMPLMTGG
jgi:molybdopterin converting factor small subunit